MVLVIARGHLPEPRTDGRNRLVTAVLPFRFDCLELGYHPLLGRLTPYDERSIFYEAVLALYQAQNAIQIAKAEGVDAAWAGRAFHKIRLAGGAR